MNIFLEHLYNEFVTNKEISFDKEIFKSLDTMKRNYFNFSFYYKEYKFDFDIKSVIYKELLKIKERDIYNIFKKINNENSDTKINTIEIEYLIAEKMIAFERMHKQKIDPKRKTRHLYDIYTIFKNNILSDDKETWLKIANYYKWIIENIDQPKNNISGDLFNNILFDKEIFNNKEVINYLTELLKRECYVNESSQKIIKWFLNLTKY